MDIRHLTPDFAVAPQLHVEDLTPLKTQGFTHIICNRPEQESAPEAAPARIEERAKTLGLKFIYNPVYPGQLTVENIAAQKGLSGKILAYCASGRRSTFLWALTESGKRPTEDILEILRKSGVEIPAQLAEQIEALAEQ